MDLSLVSLIFLADIIFSDRENPLSFSSGTRLRVKAELILRRAYLGLPFPNINLTLNNLAQEGFF